MMRLMKNAVPVCMALLCIVLAAGSLRAQESPVVQRGWELLDAGDHAGARAYAETALREEQNLLKRQRGALLIQLSFAFMELGEYRPSINTWHTLIDMFPGHHMVWGNLGWSYYCLGDLDSAIIATERALALKESMAWCWGNLGLCYIARGDIQNTRRAYNQVIRHVESSEVWESIRNDIDELCANDRRPCCAAARAVLDGAWRTVLLRWYAKRDPASGIELVGEHPETFREIRVQLQNRLEQESETERARTKALLNRLDADLGDI